MGNIDIINGLPVINGLLNPFNWGISNNVPIIPSKIPIWDPKPKAEIKSYNIKFVYKMLVIKICHLCLCMGTTYMGPWFKSKATMSPLKMYSIGAPHCILSI